MILKHSILISGHATSISLEEPFWRQLKAIAKRDEVPLASLVARIDARRTSESAGLSSALRVFVLEDALKN